MGNSVGPDWSSLSRSLCSDRPSTLFMPSYELNALEWINSTTRLSNGPPVYAAYKCP
ncbi:hypothetical protein PENANT_c028G10950 [Penicillium antarcticum]|uniref:Uncharacterized protein n=1 Tax=Penicillium antarcticum TaxID=416450 RepID=A0A1V6PWG7_9EURO|nr:hypothetical protein PENANT_c028G10950 [Penicillium antarcticum]